jgi:hypothetical protein
MILLARILALCASLLAGSGGAFVDQTHDEVGLGRAHASSHFPPTEFLRSPTGLPSRPSPIVDVLGEIGIDEEDTDRLETPSSRDATSRGRMAASLTTSGLESSLVGLPLGRAACPTVMRC